jgi:hypothetical protein
VHFTELVNFARELENALRGRGFAGIDVSENADVSVFGEVCHLPDGWGINRFFSSGYSGSKPPEGNPEFQKRGIILDTQGTLLGIPRRNRVLATPPSFRIGLVKKRGCRIPFRGRPVLWR